MDKWLRAHLACPRDKARLTDEGDDLVCPDGHVTWRNPRIVVGTLPVRAGRVYLARRSIEPAIGQARTILDDMASILPALVKLIFQRTVLSRSRVAR